MERLGGAMAELDDEAEAEEVKEKPLVPKFPKLKAPPVEALARGGRYGVIFGSTIVKFKVKS